MELGFLVKQTVAFFFEPFGMVISLLIVGIYFLYKSNYLRAKIFLTSSLVLLFLFSYPPFVNLLVQNLENQYPKYGYTESIKYIHVLGNGHNTDAEQPISSKISDAGTKRVLEGVIIHKRIPNSKLIFTGYEGTTNRTNAEMNALLAKALGVKSSDMIINGSPVDTQEEAEFTKSLLGVKPFVLVTSATHMPRAMMIFHALGMHPIAAPTNYYKSEYKGLFRAPNARYFYISKAAVHEYLGMLLVKLKSISKLF